MENLVQSSSSSSSSSSDAAMLFSHAKDLLDSSAIQATIASQGDYYLSRYYQQALRQFSATSLVSFRAYCWELIHASHWKDVPISLRRLYACCTLSYVMVLMSYIPERNVDYYIKLIEIADKGVLLGKGVYVRQLIELIDRMHMSLKYSSVLSSLLVTPAHPMQYDLAAGLSLRSIKLNLPLELDLNDELFMEKYMKKQCPVVLPGLMTGWWCMQPEGGRCWGDLNYIRQVCGYRTVPIELGASYHDDDSSQLQMTINEFIDNYILSCTKGVGYLAQHQFLGQVPRLRRDICVPDYCALMLEEDIQSEKAQRLACDDPTDSISIDNVAKEDDEADEDEEILIHFWFGPPATQSPLHHDPYHNLLAQIHGYKYVRLYPFQQEPPGHLYPRAGAFYNNSSVDIANFDEEEFPFANQCAYYETVLAPGEMLYIPRHMWHWIVAIPDGGARTWLSKRYRQSLSGNCSQAICQHELAEIAIGTRNYEHDCHCLSLSFWWGSRIEAQHT